MREEFVAQIKKLVRPVARHRFLVERAKYIGQTILDPQEGNDRLAELIHKPGVAGKIGGTEMKLVRVYWRKRDAGDVCQNFGRYAWWAYVSSGIYPNDARTLSRFCREYLPVLGEIDLLSVWFNFGEARARRLFAPKAELCRITALEPYFHERPWSAQLAGKRVVVVTPFEKTTLSQYARREKIWRTNPSILPEFGSLRIVRCPQLAGIMEEPEYPDWFAGLDALKARLSAEPFDVAIIGAGAWSLPLAAHAKALGAFGVHMGGATQLLFGIMGGRWRGNKLFEPFVNDAWTAPADEERPKKFRLQENGSYW
jgi:hypothetical protein